MGQSERGFVALGGNQPLKGVEPEAVIAAALAEICRQGIEVVNQSSLYLTPCFPAGAGPDYVNAVAEIEADSSCGAAELLFVLHRIEADFGRARGRRWGARTLDLDLLALGDIVAPDRATWDDWRGLPPDRQATESPNQLILPHPRIQDRAFVLVPWAEIAPDWRHPVTGDSVEKMLQNLPPSDREAVVRLPEGLSIPPTGLK